jgi:hypothetical protein
VSGPGIAVCVTEAFLWAASPLAASRGPPAVSWQRTVSRVRMASLVVNASLVLVDM